jgi:hypothetical protein
VLELFLHLVKLQQDQFGFFTGVIGFGLQLGETLLKLGIRFGDLLKRLLSCVIGFVWAG